MEYNALVGTETTAPLLRRGDLLVINSLDRLGRNYVEIRQQWNYIIKETSISEYEDNRIFGSYEEAEAYCKQMNNGVELIEHITAIRW